MPTRKQFHYLLEHYDELVNKYTEELAFRDESIVEKWEFIVKKIVAMAGKPIEQVEEILLGYVAVMETEMLKEYGGVRKNNMRAYTCYVLMDNGEVVFNFLAEFFFIWKNGGEYESDKRELVEFVLKKNS